MDEKKRRKMLRKKLGSVSWALLIYFVIMLVCAVAAILVTEIVLSVMGGHTPEEIEEIASSNFGGYLLACGAGMLGVFLWKGRDFNLKTVWTRGKPMSPGTLITLFCFGLLSQLVFSIFAGVQEMMLNMIGLSAVAEIESATTNMDSVSSFLYIALAAPVVEEWLFRGVILRSLEPWGKRTAIVLSAALFGLFHGNLVQTPYAFMMGLVLGYTAVEYSVGWSMVLHMLNNMFLGDTLPRLLGGLGEEMSNALITVLMFAAAIAACVILVVRHKDIAAYFRREKIDNRAFNSFFTSAGTITLMIVMVIQAMIGLSQI